MRVVLDTNVLIRIILSKNPEGVAGALWAALQHRRFQLVTSEALLLELRDTLLSPHLAEVHHWEAEKVTAFVEALRAAAFVISAPEPVEVPALARRDPADLELLAAAVGGRAELIVTQDRDLLDLAIHDEVGDLEIVDPLELLLRLRSAPE